MSNTNCSNRFALISDIQKVSIVEKLLFFREENQEAQKAIWSSLKSEVIDFLILNGDLVFDGSSNEEWTSFHNNLNTLPKVPIYANPGNHDLGMRPQEKTYRQFYERFGLYPENSWYQVSHKNLLLIFINTNYMTLEMRSSQNDWLSKTLTLADLDGAVSSVLVFTHHPPMTNALLISESKYSKNEILPLFLSAKKTKVLFSGHVHANEHFIMNNKHIITCGGIGPRIILKKNQRYHNLITEKDRGNFSYVIFQVEDHNFTIELKDVFSGLSFYRVSN
jgi:hypothetical protein